MANRRRVAGFETAMPGSGLYWERPFMGRLTKIILATVVIIPMLMVAGVILVLPRLNLAGLVALRATATLGRTVSIDSIRVSPGQILDVEIRGVRLDNIQGGGDPAMATLASLSANVEWPPLLRGSVVIRRGSGRAFAGAGTQCAASGQLAARRRKPGCRLRASRAAVRPRQHAGDPRPSHCPQPGRVSDKHGKRIPRPAG